MELVKEERQKKKETKYHGDQNAKELERELKAIDAAASAAAAADEKLFGRHREGEPAQPMFVPPPPPPPPPPLPLTEDNDDVVNEDDAIEPHIEPGAAAVKQEEEDPNVEADSGVYTVDGLTYQAGEKFEEKLVPDAYCQVFIEGAEDSDEEEWHDAMIMSVAIVPVPNTNLTLRRHTVAYFTSPTAEKETVLEDIPSDRLRIPVEVEVKTEEEIAPPLPPPQPDDENTGFGGWQTVSIRTVTAAEVAAKAAKDEAEEYAKERKKQQARAQAERETAMDASLEADDAMGAYDPSGTGRYKGLYIDNPEPVVVENAKFDVDEDGGSAAGVVFKKRKIATSGGGGLKGNRKRREND